MSNDGNAISGRYTVTCPFCVTKICGSSPRCMFDLVSEAAKALNAHMRYACPVAPRMRTERRRELAAGLVKSTDDDDA